MGFSPMVSLASEIHRAAPKYSHQHAPPIPERVDKVKFIPATETLPLIFLNSKIYLNE